MVGKLVGKDEVHLVRYSLEDPSRQRSEGRERGRRRILRRQE